LVTPLTSSDPDVAVPMANIEEWEVRAAAEGSLTRLDRN
jgi:hypothetical protein